VVQAQLVDVDLFDIKFQVKRYSCSLNREEPIEIKPYVNFYININDVCQAQCRFCEYHTETSRRFDMEKLILVLKELKNKGLPINKLNFSGGEPTLNFEIIEEVMSHIDKGIYVTLNTNGYNFNELASSSIIDRLSCISLSRHHYDDTINMKIFKAWTPTLKDIEAFPFKEKLHLRCNLIKGFIDNQEEATIYIESLSKVGVYDYGFVSLMRINEFCEEHFVDYNTFNFDQTGRTHTCYTQERKEVCNCKNFLYYTKSGELVKMYSRVNHNIKYEANNLVYDINKLKKGFNGEVILCKSILSG